MTTDGLRVLNFSPFLCREHPSKVYKFTSTHGIGELCDSLHCCQSHVCTAAIMDVFKEADFGSNEWDSDSLELDYAEKFSLYVDRLDEHSYSRSPEDSISPEIKDILHQALSDFVNTPAEKEANQALESLLCKKNLLNEWYATQCSKTKDIYDLATSGESVDIKQKHFTEFYSLFNSYLTSAPYLDSLRHLLGDLNKCGSIIKQLLTTVVFVIQRNLLQEKASLVKTDTQSYLSISNYRVVLCRQRKSEICWRLHNCQNQVSSCNKFAQFVVYTRYG